MYICAASVEQQWWLSRTLGIFNEAIRVFFPCNTWQERGLIHIYAFHGISMIGIKYRSRSAPYHTIYVEQHIFINVSLCADPRICLCNPTKCDNICNIALLLSCRQEAWNSLCMGMRRLKNF